MITDDDVKKLKKSFKGTFATKADLKAMEARQDKKFATKDDLKDLREQLNDDIDGKLVNQKQEIVDDVAEYIADTLVPMFEKRDVQIARLNKKVGISSLAD